MGEKPQVGQTSSATATISDTDDLDGIGSIFADQALESSASSGSTSLHDRMTPLDPSQWAYDSGKVIEKGAVILGGVEQAFGFGLRQQYFHKAAILIVDHDEKTFTRAIILNRPTDVMLDDDINPGVKWRVWYGGDVEGLESRKPSIICLHSLKEFRIVDASVPIMKDIQWTTFENAQKLVKVGVAKPTDFWVFAGYAGWAPGQLMGELERKSWYMVATDSQTLLKELARLGAGSDPRDAGLETWDLLMNMIGRGETARRNTDTFDDLMLKEWALKHLLSTEAGGGAGEKLKVPEGTPSTQELLRTNPIDRLVSRVAAASRGEDVTEGSLVRASSADRSPFLLDNQVFHKSVVLIIMDDESFSVGVMLNRPATKGINIQITEKDSGKSRIIELPLRFGGQYSVKGSEPLLWLHCNSVLRAAKVGSPLGPQESGIWKCTAEDMVNAVGKGLASPEEFMVISGVCIWTKGEGGIARGIQGEIKSGRYEVVPSSRTELVWQALKMQQLLTTENLNQTLLAGEEGWKAGAATSSVRDKKPTETEGALVFKSDVKVATLCDDALRSWVATFLLGKPSLDS
ncbi:hypothetical protein ACA910_017764 [Epithemia clementina (nom. ined.)]